MKGKTQMVALYNDRLKVTETFEINHAARILNLPNNGGWVLPKGSEYKFDSDNGIRYRENNKRDNGVKKEGNDKQSNSASE